MDVPFEGTKVRAVPDACDFGFDLVDGGLAVASDGKVVNNSAEKNGTVIVGAGEHAGISCTAFESKFEKGSGEQL